MVWGTSAIRTQEIAQAGIKDQLQLISLLGLSENPEVTPNPALQKLARIGSEGTNPQNCFRERRDDLVLALSIFAF